jgi:AcrR family transcriptional regulator
MQAAWICFGRNGTAATSMADVAAQAGSTAAALYLHFQTKDELVLAVMATSLDRFEAVIKAVIESDAASTRTEFVAAMLNAAEQFGHREDGINLFSLTVQSWGQSMSNVGLAQTLSLRYRDFLSLFASLGRSHWGMTSTEAWEHATLIGSLLLGFTTQVAVSMEVTAEQHIIAYNLLSGRR